MIELNLPQSIPISSSLAALGGILEVFATAVLAYPAARSVEGFPWTDRQLKFCLAMNIVFQILASVAGNLCATWFGPVAIVGPVFFASQLLANLVVFWIVLGLEAFSREMQIGTYVVVVSVILLIVNGPETQDYDGTSFQYLITQPYAMAWAILLTSTMLITGMVLAVVNLHKQSAFIKYAVLLTARATAFALNLSTGKALVMDNSTLWLTINLVIKIVSGMIYTGAIVVQSTAVQQRVFVPVNAATIVFINAMTGIIIWEDWRVVQSWIGYVCVFLLLALGCGLLLGDLGLLKETSPETFLAARVTMVYKENRQEMVDRLKNFGRMDGEHGLNLSMNPEQEASALTFMPHNRSNTLCPHSSPPFPNATNTKNHHRSKSLSEMMPRPCRRESDALSLKQSVQSQPVTRRYSTQQEQTRAHRAAWMAVYEGAGATSRRNSIRWRQSVLSIDERELQQIRQLQSTDEEIENTAHHRNSVESDSPSISDSMSQQQTN